MDISKLNYLAIVVSALAAFVVGGVWFGPKTFYPIWVKELGMDPQARITRTPASVMFALTYVAMVGLAFTSAIVLQLIEKVNGSVNLGDGLCVGLLLGVLVAASTSLTHRLFAQQGFKVWAIEVGNDIAALVIIGLILSAWR